MKTKTVLSLLSVLLLTTSIAPTKASAFGASEAETIADKKAFVRARNAAKTGTWTVAVSMLKSIDIDKLDDPDVVKYVDFSKKCASTAEKLGIAIKSNPESIADVLKGVDLVKLATKLWKDGVKNAAETLAQAKEVYEGMAMYQELDVKLCKNMM